MAISQDWVRSIDVLRAGRQPLVALIEEAGRAGTELRGMEETYLQLMRATAEDGETQDAAVAAASARLEKMQGQLAALEDAIADVTSALDAAAPVIAALLAPEA